ncbi:MAG TPA: ABC transporter ATP-binding protein [Solirubrobacteraceae bacterium]|nr:ABC transporter ATP-binding protein [Solirubrobacteraceae bacterium]
MLRETEGPAEVRAVDGPAVHCKYLFKRFGEGETIVDALRGVAVSFERRSFTAIMGPSGSGKSTLMHLLAGLDRPTSGDVWLDGRSLEGLDDTELTRLRRTRVGFVFQSLNLIPVLTAEENIVLPLRIAGEEIDENWLERLLTAVGVEDRRHHLPSELSGGQQQRVALARALMSRPSVIFADEPTGNLDSRASESILAMLRRAVDDFGQTVVMVTHDPLAATYADRVLFLRDGLVVREADRLSALEILDAMKTLQPNRP